MNIQGLHLKKNSSRNYQITGFIRNPTTVEKVHAIYIVRPNPQYIQSISWGTMTTHMGDSGKLRIQFLCDICLYLFLCSAIFFIRFIYIRHLDQLFIKRRIKTRNHIQRGSHDSTMSSDTFANKVELKLDHIF